MIVALIAALAAGAPVRVYTVDLQRAALATREGKEIKQQIESALAKIEDEVHRREAELGKLRKELERSGDAVLRARYDRESEALAKLIDDEEQKLDQRQEDLLAPLLQKLRAAAAKKPGEVILEVGEHPLLEPIGSCDVTPLIARGLELKKPAVMPEKSECGARAIFFADLARVANALGESKSATARLDAYQRSKQAELDAKQKELRRVEGKPEHERLRLELAARYADYKTELEERGRAEEERVNAAARAFVARAAGELAGAVFVEKLEGAPELDAATCDATWWLVELAEKKPGASAAAGARACASWGAEGPAKPGD